MNDSTIEERINDIFCNPTNLDNNYIINKIKYKDIYNLSIQIFDTLEKCSQDDYICIATEKKEIIAAAIICSLMGGPGLILPYSYSKQVIEEVSKNEKMSYIITDDSNESDFPGNIEVLRFTGKRIETNNNFTITEIARGIDDNFIKLFTGGSTGTPKVWTKTLKNIFSEAFYLSEKFSINKTDKFIATVPPYHIYGFLFSVIIPFINGASIAHEMSTFPREIISSIENNSATILISVPMHYRVLKKIPIKNRSLRLAFSSAGALDEGDSNAFYDNNGVGVNEIYGSTETGGIATRNRSMGENSLKPFNCVKWKIVDDRLSVKSDFISKELSLDNEGFFLTGDRIKKIGDNDFILLGRADGIIKVAGKRVDLGEIQNKIKSINDITDAIVLSIPTRSGRENEIVAMIESELKESEIKQAMLEKLEPYAVPRRIKIEKKIVLLSTGKYDRKKIKAFFE